MNTVFMIGNGFDLNLGLKTGYLHFYDHLFEKTLTSKAIEQFKTYLKQNKEKGAKDWADLEIALGKYSLEFSADRADEYITFLDKIHDELQHYIESVVGNLTVSDEEHRKFVHDLFNYDIYLNERDREIFTAFKQDFLSSHSLVSAVIFNYTETFESILRYQGEKIDFGVKAPNAIYHNIFKRAEHIHGYLNDNMLLGVNDLSQIENPTLRSHPDVIARLVKPRMNANTGSLREKRCRKAILDADVICIFGMSLGQTDKIWWEYLLRRIAESNTRLIVFSLKTGVSQSTAYLLEPERDKIKERLISYCNLKEEQKTRVREKIFIAFNTDIFKVKQQLQKAS